MIVNDLKQSTKNYITSNDVGSKEDHVISVDGWSPVRYFDINFTTDVDASRPDSAAPHYKTEHVWSIVTNFQMNEIK